MMALKKVSDVTSEKKDFSISQSNQDVKNGTYHGLNSGKDANCKISAIIKVKNKDVN